MRPTTIACLLLTSAACAEPPARSTADGFVLEPIERDVVIDAPLPAHLYVAYRAVSYAGRIVEYGVEVDGVELSVTYGIDPSARLPLATTVYDRRTARPRLGILASDRELEVYADDDAAPALRVTDYADPARAVVEPRAPMAISPELRPLLDAVLPARAQIAPVPAFWQNLDTRDDDGGGIGHTSSSGRPVLATWSLDVSLLGALFLQAPCIERDQAFACPCMSWSAPQVGAIDTCAP